MILPEIIRVLPSLFDPIRFQGQKAAAGTDDLRQKAGDLQYSRSDSLIWRRREIALSSIMPPDDLRRLQIKTSMIRLRDGIKKMKLEEIIRYG
jgi:hypothetical protein